MKKTVKAKYLSVQPKSNHKSKPAVEQQSRSAKTRPKTRPKTRHNTQPSSQSELQSSSQVSSKPLRLLAQNGEDFRILSGLLQDSILVPANVRWQKKAKRFTMPLSRFCWELVGLSKNSFFRVASCLVIEGVETAQQRGFKKDDKAEVVALLACELLATEGLRFTFSGGAELCLLGEQAETNSILARLADIGERQETQSIPQHSL